MLNHPDHTSQENFEALVTAIERGKCAVFIGAGLSTSIGYPSLKDLLWEMAREAELHELQEKEVDRKKKLISKNKLNTKEQKSEPEKELTLKDLLEINRKMR